MVILAVRSKPCIRSLWRVKCAGPPAWSLSYTITTRVRASSNTEASFSSCGTGGRVQQNSCGREEKAIERTEEWEIGGVGDEEWEMKGKGGEKAGGVGDEGKGREGKETKILGF